MAGPLWAPTLPRHGNSLMFARTLCMKCPNVSYVFYLVYYTANKARFFKKHLMSLAALRRPLCAPALRAAPAAARTLHAMRTLQGNSSDDPVEQVQVHGESSAVVASYHDITAGGYNGQLAAAYRSSLRATQIVEIMQTMRAAGERPTNTLTYNYLISAMLECKERRKAFDLLKEMEARGMQPDLFTFELLLSDLSQEGGMAVTVDELFDLMWRRYKIAASSACWTARFRVWLAKPCQQRALQLFEEMRACDGRARRDPEVYYILLKIASLRNQWETLSHVAGTIRPLVPHVDPEFVKHCSEGEQVVMRRPAAATSHCPVDPLPPPLPIPLEHTHRALHRAVHPLSPLPPRPAGQCHPRRGLLPEASLLCLAPRQRHCRSRPHCPYQARPPLRPRPSGSRLFLPFPFPFPLSLPLPPPPLPRSLPRVSPQGYSSRARRHLTQPQLQSDRRDGQCGGKDRKHTRRRGQSSLILFLLCAICCSHSHVEAAVVGRAGRLEACGLVSLNLPLPTQSLPPCLCCLNSGQAGDPCQCAAAAETELALFLVVIVVPCDALVEELAAEVVAQTPDLHRVGHELGQGPRVDERRHHKIRAVGSRTHSVH